MTEPSPLDLDPGLIAEVRARLTPDESAEDFVEAAVRSRLAGVSEEPEYLRGLQAITAALANARELSDICAVVLSETGSGQTGERAIWRLDNNKLLLVAGGEQSQAFPEIPLDDRFPARANLESGEPLFVESRHELLSRWPILESTATQAFAALPLVVDGRRLGLLAVGYDHNEHPFSPAERDYLRSVAEQTAVAIDRAELRQSGIESQNRRELIAEAMFEMAAPYTSPEALLQQLSNLAVPRFADWCVVYVRRGEQFQRVAASRSAAMTDEAEDYALARPLREMIVAAGGHENEAGILTAEPGTASPGAEVLLERLGLSSLISVPLGVSERTSGMMLFGAAPPRPIFRSADLGLASSLAARATIALDHQRTEQERRIFAETITRAILPGSLPELDGYSFGACFEPAGSGSIGGDWYDVFELRDGSYGIVVGDVSGHGVEAAAAMARLRNGLFAFASEGHSPAAALARLAPLLAAPDEEEDDLIATVKLATLNPETGAFTVANAGHPPLLIIRGEEVIWGGDGGTVLSSYLEPQIAEVTIPLEPGDLVLAYTDGLVERPGEDYDESLARLATTAQSLRGIEDLDELCLRIVEFTVPPDGRHDDCCLIALRVHPAARS